MEFVDKRAGTVANFLTLWIEKTLNSLPDQGECPSSQWTNGALGRIRPAGSGKDHPAMRVMFFTWLLLIATGLVFYTVIGLAHN